MNRLKQILKGFCAGIIITSQVQAQTPAKPFGSNTSYANGTIQTIQTPAQASALSKTWYEYWSKSFIKDCGGGKALVVNDYSGSEGFSEGQGYGMLLTAYSGDKATFDKLVKGYFDNVNQNGVMNWKVTCSGKVGSNGATDGDLDAAMALLIANKQWPGSTSPNYANLATELIKDIKTYEFTECSGKIVQKGGDFLGGCNCTNPSYYATGYYRAFAKHVPEDAAWWTRAADEGLDLLLKASHPTTGLNPAWTDAQGGAGGSGDCNNIEAQGGGARSDYQFDAARTPWRIVVDYLWWGTPKAKQYLDKITAWANSNGINNIWAAHKLDGTKIGTYTNSAFVGAFAIGAMGTTNQTVVNSFYKYWTDNSMHDRNYASGKKLDDYPYFQNSLRTAYHFVASGNFWNPYEGGTSNPTSEVTVAITSPAASSSITQGSPLTINATASSTQGATITSVEFIIDGTAAGTDNTAPYSYTAANLAPGSHTIAVKATDSNGKTATTANISITVTPSTATSVVTVALTGPSAGATFTQGTQINLTATASSTEGATITGVEFIIDGVTVSTDATAPYSYSVSNLAAGSHTISVKATDSNGKTASTSNISITVTNDTTTPAGKNAEVGKTGTAPTIDGTVDAVWNGVTATPVTNQIVPSVSGASDLSATYKTLWDEQNIYVLVNVTDDVKVNDSNEPYKDDAVELFFDIGNDKTATYGANDVQYTFRWNDNTVHAGPAGRSTSGIVHNTTATANGYILEVKIPWSTLQGTPSANQSVGFDVQVNDDDDGGERDGKLAWAAEADNAWENPSVLGVAKLSSVIASIYEDEYYSKGIKIFPNPFNTALYVDGIGSFEYTITDLSGKIIQTGSSSGSIETGFETGVYYLNFKKPAGLKPIKVVKVQ